MSGPNPPEPGSEAVDPGKGQAPSEAEIGDGATHSRAYSAPESEHFTSGPYLPMELGLYDYDDYDGVDESEAEPGPPRWPWVVGITVIIAAIALVVSVGLLVGRTESHTLATPVTTTPSLPPVHDEIITSTPPPPPPPSPTEAPEPPPPPPPTHTPEPPPPVEETTLPEPTTTTPPVTTTTTTTTTQARPLQITYSVTGTKAPFDQITITYTDASGQRRTQRNAYIPWSLTLTPISQSEVGSVEATSMLRLSKLNCSITRSDGTVYSSNSNDAPQTSC